MQVICDLKVNRKHIFGLACCRTCAKLAQSFNNAQFLHSLDLDLDMIPYFFKISMNFLLCRSRKILVYELLILVRSKFL